MNACKTSVGQHTKSKNKILLMVIIVVRILRKKMRHVCRNDQDETYKRNEMNLHTQKTKPKNSSYGKH